MSEDGDDALVDAMAAVLGESEPKELSGDAMRALAEAALSRADADDENEEGDEALVDAAADLLSTSEPDSLDEDEARELAQRALATSPAEGAEVVVLDAYRHLPILAAAAIMLFVVSSAVLSLPEEAPPTVQRFESGHRIVATAGARLEVRESADGLEVWLDGGEAMFDIEPDAEQNVRIVSGAVTVRVTGTVFTVERRGAVTRVAVFEGSVAVAGGGPLSLLSAGDRWEGEPGRRLPQTNLPFEPRLLEEAAWAAERRLERAGPVDDFVPTLPEVPDLEADGRLPSRALDEEPPTGAPDTEGEEGAPPRAQHPTPEPRPLVADARALLTDRRYEEARALADRALRSGATADWLLIRGDALRGQGQLEEAASEYTRAALVGDGRDRAVAGLSAARVLGRDLGRVGAAREILITSGATGPSSPVRAQAEALIGELGLVAP